MFFRVNSVKDVNHGAGEGKEIESHLYETADGRLKRFFDEKDIQKFFADWENLYKWRSNGQIWSRKSIVERSFKGQ